ncbi:hypothetical protein JOQ06_024495, partial [Pogonophryne albipinna]
GEMDSEGSEERSVSSSLEQMQCLCLSATGEAFKDQPEKAALLSRSPPSNT